MAGKGIPGFDAITETWGRRAPFGWDVADPTPVGNTVAFLLSDMSAGITGEMIHVDGGLPRDGHRPTLDGQAASGRGDPLRSAGVVARV